MNEQPNEEVQIQWNEDYGLWWPSNENVSVFNTMIMRVTDVDTAVKYVRTKGIAVQAGGFIGMWPSRLAKWFERVYTFEPIPHLYECVVRNNRHLPSVRPFNAALGSKMGSVTLAMKRGGCTRIDPQGTVTARQLTIDSLCLPRCDAIYLDVERHELAALAGATQTITRFHPVVVLETLEGQQEEYQDFMSKLGYNRVDKVHADVVYAPS